MIIKRITKTSLLLFAAISFASLLNASPTFALQSYNAMSTSDKALSYSYYKSIRTCFEKSNINEDIDQSKANDPPQWINDSAFGLNSEVNTGYLINDGKDTNGTAYCRDIIGRALSFWQVSGTDFLKGMGYTLKSDGTQWNFPDNSNQLTKFDSFIRSATTSELTNPNEYSLGLAALTATQDGCSATRVGLFKDQDEAIQRMATTKTNGYFTLLSPTDNAGTVTYILKREGNGSTVYSYLPGGGKGGGTECEQIASRLNSIAPAVAQATADNLYVTLSNKMFSSLSGAIKADCDTQPNNLLRTECNDGWRSTFNACFSTMKSSLAASGQNNADGSNTALYIIPGNQRIQELSLCIAKGTGADLNTIITALTEAVSSTPVPSGEDQLAKIGVPENVSTCGVDGIGWIVCPLATSISKGIDGIFNIVKGFLEFKAYTTNQGVGMYPAWSVMRNFANVAFVIAFIAIIYSQLTSAGISNYGIKKMLPRLIVAAILVNLSFWICGIAVDISNILGSSLSGLFTGLIPSVSGPAINVDWASATSAILTGTAIGGISLAVGVAGAGSFWALLWMLVPILVSALFSILVAVIILAGRQVLLIIFIVISPLAFVAYLLPNTQKWYEKWQSTFMTLLLMYPIIALIFGGSQFAAAIVRSNASNDMTVVLLSLAIQVIPLAITPMVIKLSGGLLNRFAGIVNNPKRGPVDGLKNWAKDRQALATKRGLGSENPNFVNRMGQFRDRRRRTREGFGKANENRAESMWQNTKQGKAAIDAQGLTGLQSEIDKNEASTRLKATAPIDLTLQARVSKMSLDAAQSQEDKLVKEMATNASNPTLDALNPDLRAEARNAVRSKSIADSATQIAQNVQTQEYADSLRRNLRVAESAGGIDPRGVSRVRANAIATQNSATSDAIKHAAQLLEEDNAPENLISAAQASLISANSSGDAVQARAAAQILRSTGAKGMDSLHQAIVTMEDSGEIHPDVVTGLKYDISSSGIKGKDSAMDMWATSTDSLQTHDLSGKSAGRLNQVELSGQSSSQLKNWADHNIMSPDQAKAVIAAHEKGTLPLDPEKLGIFAEHAARG